ncbi:Cdk5 activator protein [Fasciolopsis buskii]|uniref:Cdk5 activator protein n=1 Tax=Fasciolopsis buskii TaxID=27845 RepID=A0A8E0RT27_9TREM|nr:Cdk5 activator protein [Fasciolopsis buski]
MGTVLSSNSSSGAHGMTRTQFQQASYPSSSHTGLTDLPEEYYIEPASDIGPCDHSYFECVGSQSDFYLRPDGDHIQLNAQNDSLTRLDPLYPAHSSHSLGLRRIISGLNRRPRHSAKDSGQENGSSKGNRQKQSHELFTDQTLEDESSKNTASGTRGSKRRSEKSLSINNSSKSSGTYITSNSDSVSYGDSFHALRRDKCSSLAEPELAAVSRSLRSGSFNIPYRNGTPYGKPHEVVRTTCNACRHMSISVNPPTQMHLKRVKACAESNVNSGESQVSQLLQSHPRHVHFNQRRQLSEPGGLVRKRHSHYCEQEKFNSSLITRSPYPQSSPSMTDSRCFTNYALHPDTADMINRSLEQLHISRRGQVTDLGPLRSVPPRPVDPPVRQVPAKCSPVSSAQERTLNLSAIGSCSPVVYSCPYHLDYPPCAFHELPIPNVTNAAPQSPHSAAIHRTHCSVQPSPSVLASGRTTEDLLTDHTRSRRLTGLPSVNPYEVEKQDPPRSKSLTKSLSCYALKFFGGHHSYLRSRNAGKNDTSAFIQSKQKNRAKQIGITNNANSNTNNIIINTEINCRVDRQKNVRMSSETDPVSEEQKINTNVTSGVNTNTSLAARSGTVVQTSNPTRDGAIVWCDAHKKPGRPAPISCVDYPIKNECLDYNISSERELHTIVMACLYLSYSYMGNEISYPLKPFLVAETNQLLIQNGETSRKLLEGDSDQVRNRFWQYCLRIINSKSTEMLQINADPVRFTELFAELRSYESLVAPLNMPIRVMSNTPNMHNSFPESDDFSLQLHPHPFCIAGKPPQAFHYLAETFN